MRIDFTRRTICKRFRADPVHRKSLDTINVLCARVCVRTDRKDRDRKRGTEVDRAGASGYDSRVNTNGSAACSAAAKWSNIALVQQFSSVSA